jgi:hypothetical protein
VPQKYTLYTLIDITETNVTKSNTLDLKGYNQQQNFNTVLQLISLRTQPLDYKIEVLEAQDLVNFEFGNSYKGLHTVWKLEFVSEYTDVFSNNNNKTYFLEQDFDGAAFISNLNNTLTFHNNNFETKNKKLINIYFKF